MADVKVNESVRVFEWKAVAIISFFNDNSDDKIPQKINQSAWKNSGSPARIEEIPKRISKLPESAYIEKCTTLLGGESDFVCPANENVNIRLNA